MQKKYFNVRSYSHTKTSILHAFNAIFICVCDAIDSSWHSIKMLDNYTERTLSLPDAPYSFVSLASFDVAYSTIFIVISSTTNSHLILRCLYVCAVKMYDIVNFVFDSTHSKVLARCKKIRFTHKFMCYV